MDRNENATLRRLVVVAAVAATVGLVAAGAFAFGPRHGRGMDGDFREYMMNRMLDEADASDEQRAQITAIMRAAHEDVEALRDGGHGAMREEVLAVLTAETVDRAAIDAIRAEHEARMGAVVDRMTDAVVEASAVLTQEQRLAIADEMRERFERRGGRFFGGRH